MTPAVNHARIFSQRGLTNSPILRRSLVNCTRGTTAKESCRLRMTWLKIRSLAVPAWPKKITAMTAGMMARRRVINRRSQGTSRRLKKSFHNDLARQGSGQGGVLPGTEQGHRKQNGGHLRSQQGRQGVIRLLDFRHLRVTGAVKRSRGHNQNRGINQKGKIQGQESSPGSCSAWPSSCLPACGQWRASAPGRNAGKDCAASRWRPACRWRCRAFPGW